jgi:hypothetical protein
VKFTTKTVAVRDVSGNITFRLDWINAASPLKDVRIMIIYARAKVAFKALSRFWINVFTLLI